MKTILISTGVLAVLLTVLKLMGGNIEWEFVGAPLYGTLFLFLLYYILLGRWLKVDKLFHAVVSFNLLLLFSLIHVSIWWVALFVFGIGILKELHDRYKGKTGFSIGDLLADLTGILFGVLIIYLIQIT